MTYFFDTPVFAERMFGNAATQARLESVLGAATCATSRYVVEQFKGTFLVNSILLHNLLLNHRNIPEVIRKLDEFPVTQGQAVKARRVLAKLLESTDDIDTQLATLERWIEMEIMGAATDSIQVTDATNCAITWGSPTRANHGTYTLKRACTLNDPRPCRIEAFWAERRAILERHATTAHDEIPEPGRTENVAKAQVASVQVLDGERPRGKRCWVYLSDSVILAEAPDGAIVVTSNFGDFVGLAFLTGGNVRVIKLADLQPDPPTSETVAQS